MNIRKTISRIFWCYCAFWIISMATQVLIVIVLPDAWLSILYKGIGEANTDMLLSQITLYLPALPLFYLLLKKIPAWQMQEPVKLKKLHFLMVLVFCYGATYIVNFITQTFIIVGKAILGGELFNPLEMALDDMSLWAIFLTTVVVAPIMEELVFRKLLVDRLVPFGQATAVVLSGLAFGLFHGNFSQFFYATVLGMVFAYLYSYTGKIRYNIIIHMAINFVGGFLSMILVRGQEEMELWAIMGILMLGAFALITAVCAIVLFANYMDRLTWFSSCFKSERKRIWDVLSAPGFLTFFALCACLLILNF